MFSPDSFRLLYPQFAAQSDEQLTLHAEQARCFLSDTGCVCSDRQLMLMLAHLLTLDAQARAGGVAGQVTGATIDKVSVTLAAPPSGDDAWAYWLGLTPYGLQLRALLKRCTAGGLYVGGLPERSAFRSVGGVFPRGARPWRK